MLSVNASGFRLTTDGGQSWRRADLPRKTLFDIAYHMNTPFRIYGSVQDHGSYRAAVDLQNGRDNLKPMPFESAPGGEYCEHAIDPTNPNLVYSGSLTRTDYSIPAPPGGRGGGGRAAGAGETPQGPQRTTHIRQPIGASG